LGVSEFEKRTPEMKGDLSMNESEFGELVELELGEEELELEVPDRELGFGDVVDSVDGSVWEVVGGSWVDITNLF